jgi:hypothetical protein
MFIDYGEITMLAIAAVGIFSLFVRRRGRERSSWPTWLLVPIAVVLALPMLVKVVDALRPFVSSVFAIVLSRWLVALLRRERSYGWVFYIVVLIAADILIYPLAYWYADKP